MSFGRKEINVLLLLLAICLGGVAVWLYRLPSLILSSRNNESQVVAADTVSDVPSSGSIRDSATDNSAVVSEGTDILRQTPQNTLESQSETRHIAHDNNNVEATRFEDSNIQAMIENHPFSHEAKKVISGNLEENDSISRRKILNYCEYLRMAYINKNIDFLRQVYSDDALIIVGHVVKNDHRKGSKVAYNDKVTYSIRSKQKYIERLEATFRANKRIKIAFSDFKIFRHPTVDGIYGVILRQRYSSDAYSDDGFLFLLWDFRNPSLPQIHVRTWQPKSNVAQEEDIISLSDFNLE